MNSLFCDLDRDILGLLPEKISRGYENGYLRVLDDFFAETNIIRKKAWTLGQMILFFLPEKFWMVLKTDFYVSPRNFVENFLNPKTFSCHCFQTLRESSQKIRLENFHRVVSTAIDLTRRPFLTGNNNFCKKAHF